jgi:hypothetical protein
LRQARNKIGWHNVENSTEAVLFFTLATKKNSVRPETIQITVELERPLRFVGKAVGISEVVGVDGIQQALDEFSHENPKFKLQPITPDFA